jgi:hypothetical protein
MKQVNRFTFTPPVKFKHARQLKHNIFWILTVLLIENVQRIICFSLRVGRAYFLKQVYLTDFTRIIKTGGVTGKDMPAVSGGQLVQGLAASLGQYHRICCFYGRQIMCIRFAPGTDDVLVGFKYGMKGYNHKKSAPGSTLKAQRKSI